MTVASFVATQRTEHGVPHVTSCRALGVSPSWFYKWCNRGPTPRQQRRATLDEAVKRSFDVSDGRYGSPRVLADLVEDGWRVSKKSVEASMTRQGLVARPTRTRRGWLTRPDKAAPPVPDLVKRDFTALAINHKWCGDLTEVPTDEGKLYLATVEDLASKRIVGFGLSEHHDAEVATGALKMGVAVRGGEVAGVIFHSDRGSAHLTSVRYGERLAELGATPSVGSVGDSFDNALAEATNGLYKAEVTYGPDHGPWRTIEDVELATLSWVHWHSSQRLHGYLGDIPPAEFEADWREANKCATLRSLLSDETDPAPTVGAAESTPVGG